MKNEAFGARASDSETASYEKGDQLQKENRSLKQRQDALTNERASLLKKNEQIRARVEAMIGRLKGMEQNS